MTVCVGLHEAGTEQGSDTSTGVGIESCGGIRKHSPDLRVAQRVRRILATFLVNK